MNQNNIKIDEIKMMKSFIDSIRSHNCNKDDIIEKHQAAERKVSHIKSQISGIRKNLEIWDSLAEIGDGQEAYRLEEHYGTKEEMLAQIKTLESNQVEWSSFLTELETLLNEFKNFNKVLCISNIRELLRQKPDIKIGQIEKAAGVRLGYMSRLEKEGNTAEPSMEFIVTATKMLKISIDALISIDFSSLTPTEKFLIDFFEKLKSDTIQDKLDWGIDSPYNLNRIEADINGIVYHPLFSEETFYEETEFEYPEQVTRIVFNSDTFGPKTYISGDCFNLRLKNGTTLYLMDIEKSVHRTNDSSAYTKEAWMFVPCKGSQFLLSSSSNSPISSCLDDLFSVVKDRMCHPRVNNDVQYAINAFMIDDLSDDINTEPPF